MGSLHIVLGNTMSLNILELYERPLQDVLSAAGQAVAAAAWMLTELHAPNTPAGMSPEPSPRGSPSVSPYISPYASPRTSPMRAAASARPPGSSPLGSQSSRAAVPEAARRAEQDEAGQEAYWRFRADALQLTKQWQRAARKATAAFSRGSIVLIHTCTVTAWLT